MDAAAFCVEARAYGLNLSRIQLEAFAIFEKRLYLQNERTNLTSVKQDECWKRHFLDSLVISSSIPHSARVLDIGSGPGFPGACLAIARPDLKVTTLDSASKMIDFQRSLFAPNSVLPVLFDILQARAEELAHDPRHRERYDFVTGRAIAPLEIQTEVSAPFVKIGGQFVPMRTPTERDAASKLEAAKFGLRLKELKFVTVAPISASRLLPIYEKSGKTPAQFPRRWSQIKA